MINVNFFERKKINILPYIAGGIFFLLLLIMGLYFFFIRMHHQQTIEDSHAWLDAHAEEVVLSRQMNRLDRLEKQSLDVQTQLRENQYLMDTIAEEISSVVPEEATRITSFTLAEPNQITLILEDTEATMAQTIVNDLMILPFTTNVQFLYAENQSAEDSQLSWELLIDITPDQNAWEVPQ
ncbi:MAG TPA: hypothetical protein VK048_03505 [Atopostipes sp.]|nr:hypothetical protein [Atopostipes sp.]